MEDFEYTIENVDQFWDELQEIVSSKCLSHQALDDALRSYLHFTTKFKDEYLHGEYDVSRCSQELLQSELFDANKEYCRIQIVYSLLQEDDNAAIHLIASFLLFDGRVNETTFEMMNNEGCFIRLVELIKREHGNDPGLHRMLLELLYEMARVQRLNHDELAQVDDQFVTSLFQIIEELSDDVDDPYHYPVIRVLLVLNEQWMMASTHDKEPGYIPLTNRVIKVLSVYGSTYMTFGENIILLLNRETETSLQLLILKLLYLIFTTKATCEYFYTNDLRVLLDVIIRNLLDLPEESIVLRHTYLRVMTPLLRHTQLQEPPHYKRDEIIRVIRLLGGSGNAHWEQPDETTLRLVERVGKVPWLRDDDVSDGEVARKLLGISLSPTRTGSTFSVSDVAAVTEKPGVQTPSKRTEFSEKVHDDEAVEETSEDGVPVVAVPKKHKPPPPTRRRHGQPIVAPEVPVLHVNEVKKLPPKTPPARRTRLGTGASSANIGNQSGQ